MCLASPESDCEQQRTYIQHDACRPDICQGAVVVPAVYDDLRSCKHSKSASVMLIDWEKDVLRLGTEA